MIQIEHTQRWSEYRRHHSGTEELEDRLWTGLGKRNKWVTINEADARRDDAQRKEVTIDSRQGTFKTAQENPQCENSFKKELKNDMAGVTTALSRYRHDDRFRALPNKHRDQERRGQINNMIGERAPRISKIVGSTKVEVKGQDMRLYGTSKDDVRRPPQTSERRSR